MKICILSHPLHTNYGGLLQAFALQLVLKRMGHNVVTDREGAAKGLPLYKRTIYFCYHSIRRFVLRDKRYNPFNYLFCFLKERYSIANNRIAQHTNRFIDHHISTADFFRGKQSPTMTELNKYDALVVGSDQVWRPLYVNVPAYFLEFTQGINIKRIAYAASFGVDYWAEFTPSLTQICANAAKYFDAISVREDSGVALCRKHLGVEAVHLLDPTLLLDKEDYLNLIESEDASKRERVLMCYVLDQSVEKHSIINLVSTKLNLPPLEVMPRERLNKKALNIEAATYPSVSKWIAGFRDAEFVLTDSFHGTVFAIIFNKPFVAISNGQRGASRFTSLLRIFGLEHRLITSMNQLSDHHLTSIDYTSINQIKKEWQEESITFLKDNL